MGRRPPSGTIILSRDRAALRTLADQAFSRSGGAPLVSGNYVRVLRDAAENYPAWERAIADAARTIHMEMYIIHRDHVGRRFVDLLARRAREGVKVRLLYDWFGCGFGAALGLFNPLIAAGGEVRTFNPLRFTPSLGWIHRDHRKVVTVDHRAAFVSGLCIGRAWEGEPAKKREPWRDTGVEIIGPAVAQVERAFAESWRFAGGRLDAADLPDEAAITPAGSVSLRTIPTEPFTAAMMRVDMLVATMARKLLWITDAYFISYGPYLEALRQAARDGVDVRLLLPQGSDVGWTVPVSRTLYRSLLEAGVRIFEWNGTMIHAKTAVADSRWARIGSTNLNLNSWMGNWELDVAIEDDAIAQTLEQHYEEDLERSTEIVMTGPRRRAQPSPGPGLRARRSARRMIRTVGGLSQSMRAAVSGSRELENWELAPVFALGVLVIMIAVLLAWKPKMLAWPMAFLAAWVGLSLIVEAIRLWRRGVR
jgi:phosphatidylserine/phosphatidylglycerophosphate/cardiolipin synthase-like enzyme